MEQAPPRKVSEKIKTTHLTLEKYGYPDVLPYEMEVTNPFNTLNVLD